MLDQAKHEASEKMHLVKQIARRGEVFPVSLPVSLIVVSTVAQIP
jgi:hypothetical protein